MRVIDLFSGIGGFSYGLSLASRSFKTIAFCEKDKFCQKVLKKHWPDVPIFSDIKGLNGKQFKGTVELICGGFPCQPFSVAGKKRGTKDDRDLWPEMLRIIREVRPAWVLGENVAHFANVDGGHNRTYFDLEKEGYEVRTFEIPAIAVGAPHIRKRLWVLGHLAHPNSVGPQRIGTNCNQEGRERQEEGPIGLRNRKGNSYHNWAVEPSVGRVANGVPRRVDRLKALGNSVVPQIVAEIGRAIKYNHKWEITGYSYFLGRNDYGVI